MTGQGVADNPFAEADLNSNQSKVYQLGLRNPFAAAFDQDGHLILSETGWFSYEEINTGGAGANFGWPYFEGGDNGTLLRTPIYETAAGAAAFYAGVANGSIVVTPPVRAFSHGNADPGFQIQAIIGANSVYNGGQYGTEFQGKYFFADVVQGEIYMVDIHNPQDITYIATTTSGFAPVHFKQGLDGYLYYADLVTGSIGKLLITPSATLYYDDVAATEELTGATDRDVFVINDVSASYIADATDNSLGVVVYSGQKYDILFGFEEIRFNDKSIFADEIFGVTINGTNANDAIAASATVRGQPKPTNLADIILSRGGDDRIYAYGGNDTIYAGSGNDSINGMNGKDQLHAGIGNDYVNGGDGNDRIWGDSGNDQLHGGNGNDTFYIGAGTDTLFGEAGADQFVFNTAVTSTSGIDQISGFQVGNDVIVLDSAVFRALDGHAGTLDDAAFVEGTFAETGARRIVYNANTGALIYDGNGSAAGGAFQIAILGKHLGLTHADFLII